MNHDIGISRRCELFYIRKELERYGLFPTEGRILYLLRNQCNSQEVLAEKLQQDKGRIAKAMQHLEEKGFIIRKVNEKNRRQKLAYLTEEGRDMVEEITTIFKQWDEICYEGFSEEEKQLHQGFLRRIAQNAVKYREENGGR